MSYALHILQFFFLLSSTAYGIVQEAAAGAGMNGTATSSGVSAEMTYSSNSMCRQNYCINPLFPGLSDLPKLEQLQWQCATYKMAKNYLDFCDGAVKYDPALPSPAKDATPVDELIRAQDDAAMTMFFYHLSGMGYEAWDYQKPVRSDNECVRTVWKMVCYTYFPRAEAGCKEGEQSMYKRPCSSSCQNYIEQCGIECCDESVQCVFGHTKTNSEGKIELVQSGYVDAMGPSAACTGSTRRMSSSPLMLLLGLFGFHLLFAHEESTGEKTSATKVPSRGTHRCLVVGICLLLALSLQGCDMVIPKHGTGNWRAKSDYLMQFKFTPPGEKTRNSVLNSCSMETVAATSQCSGRGYCKAFSKSSIAAQRMKPGEKPLSFCMCEPGYADPECGTERKSQMTAFFLSLFFGYLGADLFYLGFPLWGVGKLFTLGGLGFWWIFDIMRTAAGPIYAYNYRTTADLPHWVAMMIILFCCMLCGFFVGLEWYLGYRKARRDDFARLEHSEEGKHLKHTNEDLGNIAGGPRQRSARGARFSGYGSTLPQPLPNAGVPGAEFQGRDGTYPYAGPSGPFAA